MKIINIDNNKLYFLNEKDFLKISKEFIFLKNNNPINHLIFQKIYNKDIRESDDRLEDINNIVIVNPKYSKAISPAEYSSYVFFNLGINYITKYNHKPIEAYFTIKSNISKQ